MRKWRKSEACKDAEERKKKDGREKENRYKRGET